MLLKVFNNNVVLAAESGVELVLTGRGIGYQKRRGDLVDPSRVEQRFVPDAQHDVQQLTAFLTELAPEYVGLAAEVLELAQRELKTGFKQSMIIPLADHLSFALQRVRDQIEIEYPLRSEVTHLFPNELRVARKGVELVRERTGVDLPLDEAIPIALHFVNAVFASDDLAHTVRMAELFRQVFEILESAYERHFDTESVNAARFITHLRYFFVRVGGGQQLSENPDTFTNTIRSSFPGAHLCAERVKALLELRLGQPITRDEVVYLTIHIARLASEERS